MKPESFRKFFIFRYSRFGSSWIRSNGTDSKKKSIIWAFWAICSKISVVNSRNCGPATSGNFLVLMYIKFRDPRTCSCLQRHNLTRTQTLFEQFFLLNRLSSPCGWLRSEKVYIPSVFPFLKSLLFTVLRNEDQNRRWWHACIYPSYSNRLA